MKRSESSDDKRPRTKKAKVKGSGAIAQGKKAKAAGKRAVIVDGPNSGNINTGDTYYQKFIQQAARAGASSAQLRKGYLAWLCTQADKLPLFASDSGNQPELSSVYTALLTEARDAAQVMGPARRSAELAMAEREAARQSALEALDQEQFLVLMGGPGSGKTTFLNFVALCMAGERLGSSTNLKLLCAPIPQEEDEREKKPKPQRWRHKALLPVRVVLRDFAADLPRAGTPVTADALWNFIVKQLPDLLKSYADDLKDELLGKGGLILLDGLDEVPEAFTRREQVKQAVQEFRGIYRRCRFLVTSRTYAYQRQDWKLNGFAERELLPFTRGQIERFIDGWYDHTQELGHLTREDADARKELLKRSTRRPELRELAARPLLLTLMARLQQGRGSRPLPENREQIYAQSVEMLLDAWEGLKVRRGADNQPIIEEPSISEWLNASKENIRRELDKLAYNAHLNQPKLEGTADIRQDDVIAALRAASTNQPDAKFTRLEEFLRDRAGMLNSHGEGLYQFPHRSFQEYLAACHLARFDFPDTLSRLVKRDPNRWREVTLLAAARLKSAPSSIWELVEELCAKDEAPIEAAPEPVDEAQWGALLAAQVLHETGLAAEDPALQDRHERKRKRVRNWQLRLLCSATLPPRERALAGDLLAELGDTRRHLLDVKHLLFAAVPRGPFWMGAKGESNWELHRNDSLDYDYWIAQTPITVAQFRQFVTATNYTKHHSAALRDPENRPVAMVSWHDAQAFCDWLNETCGKNLANGWSFALPSEAEWEKAARGGVRTPVEIQVASAALGFAPIKGDLCDNLMPQRIYACGDEFVPNSGNAEMNVGATSTPGCFAQSRSPYGCEDMSGNVWEWTRSLWGKDWEKPEFTYPYDSKDRNREDPSAGDDVSRVVRGGSCGNHHNGARCAYRSWAQPGGCDGSVGFRVVLRSAPVS